MRSIKAGPVCFFFFFVFVFLVAQLDFSAPEITIRINIADHGLGCICFMDTIIHSFGIFSA